MTEETLEQEQASQEQCALPETVVPLFGQTLAGQVSVECVSALQRLLEEARRGEISAIAYAVVRPNGWGMEGVAIGPGANSLVLLGTAVLMLDSLKRDYKNAVESDIAG